MMKLWALSLVAAAAVAGGGVVAQPLSCIEDQQCNIGYYCYQQQECRKCLDCAWLKRESLPVPSNCTRTLVDCGLCLTGFVSDPSGNLDSPCVLAGTAGTDMLSDQDPPPSYLWYMLATGILLLLITILAVAYVVRNTNTFKILATTRTSLGSPFNQYRSPETEGGAGAGAGAPPPYNLSVPRYSPVRPTSPPLDPTPQYVDYQPPQHSQTEGARPYVESKEERRARVAREQDLNQEAIAFNHPRVRFPDQPPSYESALSDDEPHPEIHDEETVESVWTPTDVATANPNQNTSNLGGAVSEPGSAAELSTLLSEARGTTVVRPPSTDLQEEASPSKVLCVRQDSNPRHNHSRMLPESGEGSSQQSQPKSLDIKIYVQQHNDVKVFSA